MACNHEMLFLISFTLHLALQLSLAGSSPSIGVCYGPMGDSLPPPREVVRMYTSHGIRKMRLYVPNHLVSEALRGSNIQVLLGLRNYHLKNLASSSSEAYLWFKRHIKPYIFDVRFRYIAIGNQVIPGKDSKYLLPAMQNLQTILDTALGSRNQIKVSTVVTTSVLKNLSDPPSHAEFSNNALLFLRPILHFLSNISSPLLVNIHPFVAHLKDPNHVTLPYALLISKQEMFWDGLGYKNYFDEALDALHIALVKVGTPQVRIVVSETGWPWDGLPKVATRRNARRYNANLGKHVSSTIGTPRKRGRVETYIFSMFNEYILPGQPFQKHWGLFYLNMSPVYTIRFE